MRRVLPPDAPHRIQTSSARAQDSTLQFDLSCASTDRRSMHRTLVAIAIGILFVAPAAPAKAQTSIALANYDGARAGLRVGHGGRGLDLQASVDSRRSEEHTSEL